MKLCYIDEAGDPGPLKSATDTTQPVLVIGGLIVDYSCLHSTTHDFVDIKKRLFPNLVFPLTGPLGGILAEVKGSEIRKHVGRGDHKQQRHAIRFLDETLALIKRHQMAIVARVWIKGIGEPFNGTPVYTSSVQAIYTYFQDYLTRHNDYGIVVSDSRTKALNVNVSHSIFTQKFRPLSDCYNRIYELPTFSHSDNHVGLQLSDIISSGLLFSIASHVYCSGHVTNIHVQPDFVKLKARYADDLKALQYRYRDATGKHRGGIVVADSIGGRSGKLFFQ